MRRLIALLLVTLSTTTTLAHPGWGIVQDSRGNVFFTDTKQVWKVTPDGRMSVAVGDVHTHELCVDAHPLARSPHTQPAIFAPSRG